MKLTRLLFLSLIAVCLVSTPAISQRGRGNRPPLTPEQQAQQAERRAAQALADGERPIDMLDTVWTEEMTWMEVRDSIAAGKTTAIIGTGGVEKNGRIPRPVNTTMSWKRRPKRSPESSATH